MNEERVEELIRGIYGLWHQCALPKREGKTPKGTLCDSCNDEVAAHMADLREGESTEGPRRTRTPRSKTSGAEPGS